jgi:hypothetical protein
MRFPFTGALEIGLGLLDGRLSAPCGGSLLPFLCASLLRNALVSSDLFLGRGSRSTFSVRWLQRGVFGGTRSRCRRARLQRNSRQHLETAWLERLREATKWLGRFGRKRQRFERPHHCSQGIAARMRPGRIDIPRRLRNGRGHRLVVGADRRAQVDRAALQGGYLGAPQFRPGSLNAVECRPCVPVHLVHGSRNERGLLQLLDALCISAFQLSRQLRSRLDKLIEWLAVQVVDLLVEGGHALIIT